MPEQNVPAPGVRCIVVSHARLERAGSVTFEAARARMVRVVDLVLAILARDDAFHSFTLDGQTLALEDYLAIRPERRAEVEGRVRAGRLVVGPWFVPTDTRFVGGEALIRNLQLGLRTARALGCASQDAFIPGSSDFVAQLPQILRGFGLRASAIDLGLSREESADDALEFEWQGPDGSRLLVIDACIGPDGPRTIGRDAGTGGVDLERATEQLFGLVAEREACSAARVVVLGAGSGDTLPQAELPRILDHAGRAGAAVRFAHGDVRTAVDLVVAAGAPLTTRTGELCGNPARSAAGAFSARIQHKLANQRVESTLARIAEPLVAALGRAGSEHVALLEAAWCELLVTHARDTVRGTCIDAVADAGGERTHGAETTALEVASAALRALACASGLSARDDREIVAVYNPHPESVAEPAAVEVLWRGALDLDAGFDFTLFDPDGRGVRVDVHLLDEGACEVRAGETRRGTRLMVAFEARVPAFGVAFYELAPGPDPADWHGEEGARNTIENEHYKVEARRNGTVAITHKPTGRVYEDALVFEDQLDAGDLARFVPDPTAAPSSSRGVNNARIETLVDPTGRTLSIEFEWKPDWLPRHLAESGETRIHTSVHLVDGVDRVDFATEITSALENHRLRVLLPVGRGVRGANAGTTFGVAARAKRSPATGSAAPDDPFAETAPATQEARDYLHVEDEQGGVFIALRGLCEFELIEKVTKKDLGPRSFCALTLVRGVGRLALEDAPAGASLPVAASQFVAPEEFFEYAWAAVPRGVATAELAPRGFAFSQLLHVEHVWLAAGARPAAAPRPMRYGLLKIDNPLVTLSAFRLDASGRLIARAWNRDSRPQKAMIALAKELCSAGPPARADRCDLNEQPIREAHLVGAIARVEFGPHEIATIAFTFESQP